jgi:hypothetical protein
MIGFRGLDWVYDMTERNRIVSARALAFQKRINGARCEEQAPSGRGAQSIRMRAGTFGADRRSQLSQLDGNAGSGGHGEAAA